MKIFIEKKDEKSHYVGGKMTEAVMPGQNLQYYGYLFEFLRVTLI